MRFVQFHHTAYPAVDGGFLFHELARPVQPVCQCRGNRYHHPKLCVEGWKVSGCLVTNGNHFPVHVPNRCLFRHTTPHTHHTHITHTPHTRHRTAAAIRTAAMTSLQALLQSNLLAREQLDSFMSQLMPKVSYPTCTCKIVRIRE